ncbi:MAG: rod shape-determining protein MreD [Bacteroidales bacterium]|nr:rod shape-determining protein MreD [Bacteroidales bacterium]MDD4215974.1 rod shape-determining protein MreD [Bacteroidales bacterium]MDY0140813.1 rod shape-determining protein MreD [Bacteroidales bacterium]
MIKQNIRYIILFLVSVLVQTLIFDRIYITSYFSVYVYFLFILLLPVNANKYTVMALAFLLGLSVDIFNSTQGLHAAATVLLAYLRPFALRFFSPRDDYEPNKDLSVRNYGLIWFLKYAGVLIFTHHLFLFYLELFSFSFFFFTLLRVVLSSIISLFFVSLGHFLFVRE